jgi:anti-sigma factor RsiW
MHPLTFEKLIEYAADETSADELAQVSAHVLGCTECTATVNRFRNIRSIVRADISFVPPTATIARAQAIFVRHPVPSKWLPISLPVRAFQAAAAIALVMCLLVGGVGITLASQDIPANSPLYPLKVTIQAVE